ncbi:MAG: hypothetical protein RMJ98_18520 [Myxococcales bacterium]|nr:hypothetical protein [Polyangiaceae bacterium]MDW8251294.1 hypothetical protein [Myxococcales bacterium]
MNRELTPLILRGDELYRRVLSPLLLGGSLRPVRPLGPTLARRIAELADTFTCSDLDLQHRCDEARLRHARTLAPLDTLPPLSSADWMLLAAFNDLLQSVNPRLPSVVAPSRPTRLLNACSLLLASIPPPHDLLAALTRHATFARALEVHRVDTQVRWWTGSAQFHGEPPSKRLLAMPNLRRVQITETWVELETLPLPGFPREHYHEVLAAWLALSPLTDLATAARIEPPFRWHATSLGLIATVPGRRLARRVLGRIGAKGDVALEHATRELEKQNLHIPFQIAARFLDERRALASMSS